MKCVKKGVCNMAGCRITPVLVFWTGRAVYWVKFTFETGFELPRSWTALPCYGLDLNRNSFCVMRWPRIGLGAQNLSGFNGQNTFQKVAGSKILDEYYSSYLKKISPIPTSKCTNGPLKTLTISLF
jgi:hypothetical protein